MRLIVDTAALSDPIERIVAGFDPNCGSLFVTQNGYRAYFALETSTTSASVLSLLSAHSQIEQLSC